MSTPARQAVLGSVFAAVVCAYLLALQLAIPFQPLLVRDMLGTTLIVSTVYLLIRRRRIGGLGSALVFLMGALLIMYVFTGAMLHLADTPVPRLKTFLKFVFSCALLALCFLHARSRGAVLIPGIFALFAAGCAFVTYHFAASSLQSMPLAAVAIALVLLAGRPGRPVLDLLDAAVMVFLIVVMISTALSPVQGRNLGLLAHILVCSLLFLLGRHFVRSGLRAVPALVLAFLPTTAILFVFTVYSARAAGSFFPPEVGGLNINGLAGFLAVMLPLALTRALHGREPRERIAAALSIVFGLPVLLACNSRASVLGVLGAVLLIVVLQGRPERRLRFFLVALAAGSALVGLVLLVALRTSSDQLGVLSTASVRVRVAIWWLFVHNGLAYAPWFGFGPNALELNMLLPAEVSQDHRTMLLDYIRSSGFPHGHSVWVQTFSMFGMVGLVVCVLATCSFGAMVLRRIVGPGAWSLRRRAVAVPSLAAIALQSTFDYTLADPMTAYPLALLAGTTVAGIRLGTKRSAPGRSFAAAAAAAALLFMILPASWSQVLFERQLGLLAGGATDGRGNILVRDKAALPGEVVARLELIESRKLAAYQMSDVPGQLLGEVHFHQWRTTQSRASLDRAVERYTACTLAQPRPFCYLRLSRALAAQGRPAAGGEALRQAQRHDPLDFLVGEARGR